MENEETTQAEPEVVVPPKETGAAALVKIGTRGVALTSLEDLVRFARLAAESGLCPKGMGSQAAAIAIQAGLERGMTPIAALQAFVVINGNLSVRGSAAHAMVENSPVCVPGSLRKFIDGEGENRCGVAVAWRKGYPSPEVRRFSVQDAITAKLWGKAGTWTTNPDRMLMWRAEGHLFTDVFPDVTGNFPIAEVAEDFEARETTRGETPASRVAAGLAPAPGADPLAAMLAEAVDVEAEDIPEGME
jgi:hypothetical protein